MAGFKKVNNSDPGTVTKHGGNDIDDISTILNGGTVPGKSAILGKQHIPLSADIAKYIQSIVSAITSDSPRAVLQNNGNATVSLSSTNDKRVGQVFASGAAEIGNMITGVSFWIKKAGAPTGTATIVARNSADAIVATFGTIDVSTLTTSFAKHTRSGSQRVLQADDKILIEYSGGDGSNRLEVHYQTSNDYDSTNSFFTQYNSSYSDITTFDYRFEFDFDNEPNLFDDNTGTKYTSSSIVNPQLVLKLPSLQEIAAIAIYRDALDTTTQITVEVSPDNVTYTLMRTLDVSFITTGQYIFVLINRPLELMQFIRIIGTDGTAKVLSYAEIKVRTETESVMNRLNEPKTISTTDILLKPNGDP